MTGSWVHLDQYAKSGNLEERFLVGVSYIPLDQIRVFNKLLVNHIFVMYSKALQCYGDHSLGA